MGRLSNHTAFAHRQPDAFEYAGDVAAGEAGATRRTLSHASWARAPARGRLDVLETPAAQRAALLLLRLSLAAVFFWFGILKVVAVSPAAPLIKSFIPFLAESPYIELLGLAEMLIAVGLVVERLARPASVLMTLHLLCTLCVLLWAPQVVFTHGFPVLSLEGEFVVKNLVFISAGCAIAAARH